MHVQRIPEIVVPGLPLGRHIHHDPRSKAYPVQAGPRSALVSVRHERHIPVLNQGELGSCTLNAGLGAVGTSPFWDALPANLRPSVTDANADEQLAVKFYSEATEIDPFPGSYPPQDTGSDGLSAAKVLKKHGYISGYRHAMSLDAALTALQAGPVITGVNWYAGMDSPDANGLVHVTGGIRGGHEFVVDELDVERERVGATNSWGLDWGQGGRFYLSFADWGRLLQEQGDATIFVPLTSPAPTPTPPTPTPANPWDELRAEIERVWDELVKFVEGLVK